MTNLAYTVFSRGMGMRKYKYTVGEMESKWKSDETGVSFSKLSELGKTNL